MRRSLALGIFMITLALLAGRADAGVFQRVSYTPSTMKTMLKAVHYPRAHLRRLSCTGLGTSSSGRYGSFRCVARWRPRGRKVFYAAGAGYGGWLCVGKSVAGCKVLDQGYASQSGPNPTPYSVGKLAAQGYLQNHFHRVSAAPSTIPPCRQPTTNVVICDYQLSGPSGESVGIRITLTPVAGGWVFTGVAGGAPPPF